MPGPTRRTRSVAAPAGPGSVPDTRPGLVEVLALGALVALHLVAVFVTYARLPAAKLYNVSGSGFVGGASRVLVDVNFPVALIAVAWLALATVRWLAHPI